MIKKIMLTLLIIFGILIISVFTVIICLLNKEKNRIKINVYKVGTETVNNNLVNSYEGDIVYYSDHGIYLNDDYVQGFDDDVCISGLAMDSEYIYYCYHDKNDIEAYSLVEISRENGEEQELLSASSISLIQFEEDVLICYEEDTCFATLKNGVLSEIEGVYDKISSDNSNSYILDIKKEDFCFVYSYSEMRDCYYLNYIEKGMERKNLTCGGGGVVVKKNNYYTTDQKSDSRTKTIELPLSDGTDQSLFSWDDNELFIIAREAGGPGAYNYTYSNKRSDMLFVYDFHKEKETRLIRLKPSEGQIIGFSSKNEKIYVLKGNKIFEMTYTGEEKEEITDIPIVESVYVEMCEDKLYIFEDNLIEGYKLLKTIDI